MDVGAGGGYYTQKTPKLLLHEWCLRAKRPKPRYKALPEADGTFRCRASRRAMLVPLHERKCAIVV
jgi:hypothetical protein